MKNLSKCRILITGVQGQVGFEIMKALSTTGAELILAVRRPSELTVLGHRSVFLDLSDPEGVKRLLLEEKPEILINPAAYTAVDKAESSQSEAFAVNEQAVKAMVEGMEMIRGAIIHFSTDYVYNPNHSRLISEKDSQNPVNVYATSKLAGDRLVLSSSIPHVILRTSWVYGINGNNFVKTMLKLGRDRETLKIVNDQFGSPTSALTLAQSVASILSQGREDPLSYLREKSGVYNLSDSGHTNWLEFAQEIFRLGRELGFELAVKSVEGIPTCEYPTPAKRPLNSRMDLSKIGKTFSIYPSEWQLSLGAFLYQARLKLI